MSGIFDETSYYLIGIFLFLLINAIYVKINRSNNEKISYIKEIMFYHKTCRMKLLSIFGFKFEIWLRFKVVTEKALTSWGILEPLPDST